MKNKSTSTSTLFGPFKMTFQWWMLIAGVVCLLLGVILPAAIPCARQWFIVTFGIVKGIGDLIIIGVLFGFLSTHDTIVNNYHKRLVDLFYGSDHLKDVKNISQVWDNVTEALIASRFPANIKDKMFAQIKEAYLPEGSSYYYEDYVCHNVVSWKNDTKTCVEVKGTTKMNVFPIDSTPVVLTYTFCSNDVNEYKIDDVKLYCDDEVLTTQPEEYNDNEGYTCKKYSYTLPAGRESYHVKRIVTKSYNLKKDGSFISVIAHAVTHNMQAILHHPDDMDVQFLEMGTCKPFETLFKQPTSCGHKFDGIVLRKQGFCFLMEKRES